MWLQPRQRERWAWLSRNSIVPRHIKTVINSARVTIWPPQPDAIVKHALDDGEHHGRPAGEARLAANERPPSHEALCDA
jgi:hypothetical protein